MQLIEKYIAAWNTTDATARRQLVDEVFAADAAYTDPLAAVTGRDQIDALIAGAQGQFAGLEFRLAGPVDAHHDIARFTWHLGSGHLGSGHLGSGHLGSGHLGSGHLGPRDAEPIVVGFDVAEIADGRIAKVHGFLDKVPA